MTTQDWEDSVWRLAVRHPCAVFKKAMCQKNLKVIKMLAANGIVELLEREDPFFLDWVVEVSERDESIWVLGALIDGGVSERQILSRATEPRTKRVLAVRRKIKERQAVRKIISWWIPICYDVNRECGKRMMEKNWQKIVGYGGGSE